MIPRHHRALILAFLLAITGTKLCADDPIPACRLGYELQQALGFGAQQLAALGVNASAYQSIALAAEGFCEQNRNTVEPLLAALREARGNAASQYESGSDAVATADQTAIDAIDGLTEVSSSIITTMRGYLSTEQQSAHANIASNRLLDPRLAGLSLSTEQRTSLRTAQRARNSVLRHHKLRANPANLKTAIATFEAAVSGILDSNQRNQYQQAAEWLHANDVSIAIAQEQNCQES